MTTSSVRFAVVKEGKPRCVLSVAERSNGDLILHLRNNELAHDISFPFATDEFRGNPIQEFRYSIHVSPESEFGVNTIKLTRILKNGDSLTGVQYTLAIKKFGTFAPVYARRCGTLNGPGQDITKRGARYESMGPINKNFNLFFMVFVGPANVKFEPTLRSAFQFKQVFFREFSLVMMWSFLPLPEQGSGRLVQFSTGPGQPPNKGLDANKCVMLYARDMEALRRNFVELLEKEPTLSALAPYMRSAIFLSEARLDTFEGALLAQIYKQLPPVPKKPK